MSDHVIVRADLRTLLELLDGVRVVGETGSIDVAMHTIEERKPDIALIDLDMRGMDGCDAIQRIRAQQPGLGVFALTVHADPAVERAAQRAGADEFFVKGRDSEALLEAIRNFRQKDG